jgi:hypothetical protein
LLLFGCLALLTNFLGADGGRVARVLVAASELGLPLAAGVGAAGVVTVDPATNIQLALKTSYRRTLGRRIAVLATWTSGWALLYTFALHLAGLWGLWVPEAFLVGQLVWISPVLWFVAAGALLAILTRGGALAASLLGGLWIFENLSYEPFLAREWLRPLFLFTTVYAPGAPFWLANRVALVAGALIMGALAWAVASRVESAAGGNEA